MDDYFKLPTGYACIQRNGDQFYAYTNNYQTRDTYELINYKYIKVASNTNNYGFTANTCLPSSVSHVIPSSISGDLFVSLSLFIVLIVSGLFYVFKR